MTNGYIDTPLYVGFPAYGSVEPATATCLVAFARRVVQMAFDCREGTFIAPARQSMVDSFLQQKDFNYLLFIDADMTFTVEDVDKLIEALKADPGMGAICGNYLRRDGSRVPVCSWEDPETGVAMARGKVKEKAQKLTDAGEIAEVKVFGAGLLLITREALEKLEWPLFEARWDRESFESHGVKQHHSEDVWFTFALKKAGFRPSVHFGVSPGHMTKVVSKPMTTEDMDEIQR